MQNYRNLVVWQKAHQLTLDVYSITTAFPDYELYGITSQLRRSSSSIPTNLAEGSGKLTDRDFRRFVNTSFGSANELEYLLFLSFCLGYLVEAEYLKLDAETKEVKKMLSGLIHTLSKGIKRKFFFICLFLAGCFLLSYLFI